MVNVRRRFTVKRDPVAPAKRSATALEKVHTRITEQGTPVHSLRTLIAELATLVRNTCRTPRDLEHPATFQVVYQRAFEAVVWSQPAACRHSRTAALGIFHAAGNHSGSRTSLVPLTSTTAARRFGAAAWTR